MNTTNGQATARTCCICGAPLPKFGGCNPEPAYIGEEWEQCCDACNFHIVMPAREYIAKLTETRLAASRALRG